MSDAIHKFRILYWLILSTAEEWKKSVWHRELDQPYCCRGAWMNECACGGLTVREVYAMSKPEDKK